MRLQLHSLAETNFGITTGVAQWVLCMVYSSDQTSYITESCRLSNFTVDWVAFRASSVENTMQEKDVWLRQEMNPCAQCSVQVSISEGNLGKKICLWLQLSKAGQENFHEFFLHRNTEKDNFSHSPFFRSGQFLSVEFVGLLESEWLAQTFPFQQSWGRALTDPCWVCSRLSCSAFGKLPGRLTSNRTRQTRRFWHLFSLLLERWNLQPF